jgi:organic radical activating enzyme
LRCPGCYAYHDAHLGNGKNLRQLSELRGKDLVEGVLDLIRCHRPLRLSIIGGEPLLRQGEMDDLLPKLHAMNMEVQFVTSAVRPIPPSWAKLPNLHLVVSVDGLPPEHNRRRVPAIYERLLNNVADQKIIVHCVILRSMLAQPGYLKQFAAFWSSRRETRKIWFSLYTPQQGEQSQERLTEQERIAAIEAIAEVSRDFPVVYAPKVLLNGCLSRLNCGYKRIAAFTATARRSCGNESRRLHK